jgi:hypothetical protein
LGEAGSDAERLAGQTKGVGKSVRRRIAVFNVIAERRNTRAVVPLYTFSSAGEKFRLDSAAACIDIDAVSPNKV